MESRVNLAKLGTLENTTGTASSEANLLSLRVSARCLIAASSNLGALASRAFRLPVILSSDRSQAPCGFWYGVLEQGFGKKSRK